MAFAKFTNQAEHLLAALKLNALCMPLCLVFQHCAIITHTGCTLQAVTTAKFNVEVRLHSYDNPTHRDCAGDVCDVFALPPFRKCDNIFTFCL